MLRQRLVILSVVVVLCGATTTFAQSPRVGLFSDAGASGCSLTDTAPGFFQVFIVLQNVDEMDGVEFQVVAGPGFTAVLVGELSPLPAPGIIGDAYSGIELAFGGCYSSPLHIYTLTYQGFGTSAPCAYLAFLPNPGSTAESIRLSDCLMGEILIPQSSTGMFYMNPDGSCNSCGFPVPVEQSTWGGVKALYN